MSIDLGGINYLAVVAAVIVQFAGGAAWYGLLANPWLAAVGKSKEEVQSGGAPWGDYVLALACAAIGMLALAVLVQATGASGPVDGLVVGLIAGVGFVATIKAVQYRFEGRPMKLYLINTGYPVVVLAIGGVILGAWQ